MHYTNKLGQTFELADVKVGNRYMHVCISPYRDGDRRDRRITKLLIEVTKVDGCGCDWKTVEVLEDLNKPSWAHKERGFFIERGGASIIKHIWERNGFKEVFQ